MLTEADDWPYANWLNDQEQADIGGRFADLDDIQPAGSIDPEELQLEDFLPFDKDDMMVIDYDETILKNSGTGFTALNAKQELEVAAVPTSEDGAIAAEETTQAVAPNPATASTPVGYAAFREAQSDGTKKKGRPKGWKKSIHGKAAMAQKQSELESFFLIQKKNIGEATTSELEDEVDMPSVNHTGKEYNTESAQDKQVEDQIKIEPTDANAEIAVETSTPQQQLVTQEASVPVGYSAFRQAQVGSDGKPVKKKGRPIGWKKSLHSRAAQGLPPSTKSKKTKKFLAGDIMSDVLKAEVKIEPPENTFQLMVEEEDLNKIEALEDVSESRETDVKEEDEQQPEIQQPETSSDPARKDDDEAPMTPLFWSQVVDHASQAEASSSAFEQGEIIERRDSVMGELIQLKDKDDPSVTAMTYFPELIEPQPEQKIRSAAAEVFSIYELVERILLSMPKSTKDRGRAVMQTILLAQRVNKTFRHVIQRSLKLQQELFFKPRAPISVAIPKHIAVKTNPLLEQPVFDSPGKPKPVEYGTVTISQASYGLHATFLGRCDAAVDGRFSFASGGMKSWSRMLLCHGLPAEEELSLLVYDRVENFWPPVDGRKVPATMTMGQLMNAVEESRGQRSKAGRG